MCTVSPQRLEARELKRFKPIYPSQSVKLQERLKLWSPSYFNAVIFLTAQRAAKEIVEKR